MQDFDHTTRGRSSAAIPTKRNRVMVIASVALLLLFSLYVRHYAFFTDHTAGDQFYYISLANKLSLKGMEGYNLHGVHMAQKGNLSCPVYVEGVIKGNLIEGLENSGIYYYDMPLFYAPPLLSYLIRFSHSIFSPHEKLFFVSHAFLGEEMFNRPREFFLPQFYCTVIPIFFSLLLIITTYFLGKSMFSHTVGLIAAFSVSVSPIEILSAYKVWADGMLSFFVCLAVLMLYQAEKKGKTVYYLLSTASAALGVLSKGSGFFILPTLVLFYLWRMRGVSRKAKGKEFLSIFFNKKIICALLLFFLLIVPWHFLLYKTYQTPIYSPSVGSERISSWEKMLDARPKYLFYLVGIPYRNPLFILGFVGLILFLFGVDKAKRDEKFILTLWFLIFFYFLRNGKEARYMLPAYPSLAILLAVSMDRMRRFLNNIANDRPIGNFVIFIALSISSWWSIKIAFSEIITGSCIMSVPY